MPTSRTAVTRQRRNSSLPTFLEERELGADGEAGCTPVAEARPILVQRLCLVIYSLCPGCPEERCGDAILSRFSPEHRLLRRCNRVRRRVKERRALDGSSWAPRRPESPTSFPTSTAFELRSATSVMPMARTCG